MAYGEVVGYYDLSVSTLIGAQFVLFTGSILHLGSKYHHDTFLADARTMRLRGCFAMTGTVSTFAHLSFAVLPTRPQQQQRAGARFERPRRRDDGGL